jgi:hypothetical protein
MPELPVPISESDSGRWRLGDPNPKTVPARDHGIQPLFKDDDGRWYLYWGSSNKYPLYGIELDLRDAETQQRVRYVGKPRALITLEPQTARLGALRAGPHGREQAGVHRRCLDDQGEWSLLPAVRGAGHRVQRLRHRHLCVRQAPRPVRIREVQPRWATSPAVSCTARATATLSRTSTATGGTPVRPWIGYNWTFERRIALFPRPLVDDGQMSVNTRFADFPHYMPTDKVTDPESLFTGWMLLVLIGSKTVASSTLGEFSADRVTDEDPRTFWVAATNEPGQMLTVDLGGPRILRAVQVNFADYLSGRFGDAPDIYTEFKLEWSADGRRWQSLAKTGPERRDRPNAYFQLPKPGEARFVRYVTRARRCRAPGHQRSARVRRRGWSGAQDARQCRRRSVGSPHDDGELAWCGGRGGVQRALGRATRPPEPLLQVFADQETQIEGARAQRRRAVLRGGRSVRRERRLRSQQGLVSALAARPAGQPA